MIDKNKKLNIPRSEKVYITKDVREKLLIDLLNEYENRYDTLTLEYVYLNNNPEKPLDYIVLFKTRNDNNTMDLIVYDAPLIYSDRSIPGYRYCKREKMEKLFFEEAIGSMVILTEARFKEIIEVTIGLEYDNEGERHWKNAEYAEMIAAGLVDISLRYVRK